MMHFSTIFILVQSRNEKGNVRIQQWGIFCNIIVIMQVSYNRERTNDFCNVSLGFVYNFGLDLARLRANLWYQSIFTMNRFVLYIYKLKVIVFGKKYGF